MTSIAFSNSPLLQELHTLLDDPIVLNGVSSLLGFDQETSLPKKATTMRAKQLGLLATMMHDLQTNPKINSVLQKLEEQVVNDSSQFTVADVAFIREARRSYDMHTKLPSAFVKRMSEHTSKSLESWKHARKESNFSLWQNDLQIFIDLCKEQVEYLGYDAHPYDALLHLYEPYTKTVDIVQTFTPLQTFTSALLTKVQKNQPAIDTSILYRTFPIEKQKEFNAYMATVLGYDFDAGQLAVSTHPFSTTIGTKYDSRITTRYDEHNIWMSIGSTIHEVGHALYEQGIADTLDGTILGGGVSLGIHESQSRLYENMIGKSRAFWQYMYPKLVSFFPGVLHKDEEENFVQAINLVQPGFIRTEADELTYNLHIIVRFELEIALLEGSLHVRNLEEAWNAKMKQYIGIIPDTSANGVLQDIHWSMGSLGYFPTYTLGNIYSAQLWHTMKTAIPSIESHIAQGDLHVPLTWLREHIHMYGGVFPPAQLCTNATGQTARSLYLEEYLAKKFTW